MQRWNDVLRKASFSRRWGPFMVDGLLLSMIVVLGGWMTLRHGYGGCEHRPDTTRVILKNLHNALSVYKVKFQTFPTTDQGLAKLTESVRGRRILSAVPLDPWEEPLVYEAMGTPPTGYVLFSKGPDRIERTPDDIRLTDFLTASW